MMNNDVIVEKKTANKGFMFIYNAMNTAVRRYKKKGT